MGQIIRLLALALAIFTYTQAYSFSADDDFQLTERSHGSIDNDDFELVTRGYDNFVGHDNLGILLARDDLRRRDFQEYLVRRNVVDSISGAYLNVNEYRSSVSKMFYELTLGTFQSRYSR